MRDFTDATAGNCGFTHIEHFTGVAMKTIFYHSNIDIDNIAAFESPIARDPMTDLVVNRGTDGFGEPMIVQRGRGGFLLINNIIVTDAIEFIGCGIWLYMR